MTDEEKLACDYLPDRLRDAAVLTISRWNCAVSEIRLRRGGQMSLTMCGQNMGILNKNVLCGVICTYDEVARTVEKLCGGSLYSHSESIREGVIVTESGFRVGVSGRAVVIDGKISCVREISSVNIRIPHRVPHAADELFVIAKKYGSVLLCSLPEMGKTTMLRELIPLLSEGESAARVAVIDTRFELGAGMKCEGLCDFYSGWSRYDGITSAIRTMSPEWVICDEIGDESDLRAVTMASAAGVKIVCSAHGDDLNGIKRNPSLRGMIESGVLSCVCGINKDGLEIWEAAE